MILDWRTSSLLFQALMILGFYNCLLAQLWKLRNHDITNPNNAPLYGKSSKLTIDLFLQVGFPPKKMAPIAWSLHQLNLKAPNSQAIGEWLPVIRAGDFWGETCPWGSGPLRFPMTFRPSWHRTSHPWVQEAASPAAHLAVLMPGCELKDAS